MAKETRAFENEIDERKKLIGEYRDYLRHIADPAKVRMKLVLQTIWKIDTELSATNVQFEICIERQA